MHTLVEVRGHTFLADPLGKCPRVLDLGANRGTFAKNVTERFGADVRLVEANPGIYAELVRSGIGTCLHCAVIGNSYQSVRFNIARNEEGSSIFELPEQSIYGCTLKETVEVPARTLPSLLEEIGWDRVDLVKMDIEGAEVEVLDSLGGDLLGRISQMAVEFHGDSSFGFGIEDRVQKCLKKLAAAGFFAIDFTFPYRKDVLLVNANLIRLSLFDRSKWWLIYVFPRIIKSLVKFTVRGRFLRRS